MELVRKVASFGASEDDLKTIYFLIVRSLLEQSATVRAPEIVLVPGHSLFCKKVPAEL